MNSVTIEFITDPNQKEFIAGQILNSLPEWFGIPEYTLNYIKECHQLPFFSAKINGDYVGFIALKAQSNINLELYVLGVLKQYHHQGIGKQLFNEVKLYAKQNGYRYLTVKTLDDSVKDESYKHTRDFYYAMGFERFEVFPTLWDEGNTCLLMIYQL